MRPTIQKSKISIALIVSFLLLAQYKFSAINLGYILCQLAAITILVSDLSARVEKRFLVFLLSVYGCLVFSIILYKDIYHGTIFYYINGLSLVLVVAMFSNHIRISHLYTAYLVSGLLFTLIVYLQSAYLITTGNPVAPLRLLPVSPESMRLWEMSPRPSGVFTEPQLYASYVLPLFLLSVLKRRFISSFILLLGILISGSTYGLLIIAVLLLWLLVINGYLTRIKSWIGGLLMCCVLIVLYVNSNLLDNTVEKLMSTDFTEGIRVAKAPLLFWEMSIFEKLFGMGSTVEAFIRNHIYEFPWLLPYVKANHHLLGYVTGLFGLGISFGIIPMVLFLYMLANSYLKGDKFQKGMSIILFLHSISATILFNGYFVFFFTLLFAKSYDGSSKLRYWKFK